MRIFRVFNFLTSEVKNIQSFKKSFGQVGFCKLMENKMLYVRDFRNIETIDVETGLNKQVIGVHNSDIVALNWAKVLEKKNSNDNFNENRVVEKTIVISVDYDCNVRIWDDHGLIHSQNITEFAELSEEYRQKLYFTMGYPYFVIFSDKKLAVSTDVGVLVISSTYLSKLTLITE